MTELLIKPANEASWEDLQTIFGKSDYSSDCQCQRFKVRDGDWRVVSQEEREARLLAQTGCSDGSDDETSGLVGYLDGEPVGWCAVEPRTAYVRLLRSRVPWAERNEDPDDDGVWAVTCFVTRKGFRRRGITYELAKATVDFARERGARALEGYPMITYPGKEITWGELHVGSHHVFAEAGFKEVTHPTKRRLVMRIDF